MHFALLAIGRPTPIKCAKNLKKNKKIFTKIKALFEDFWELFYNFIDVF